MASHNVAGASAVTGTTSPAALTNRLTSLAGQFLSTDFGMGAVVYFGGSVLSAVLPMLLLPVLTRYLTPTDYGLVSTSTVIVQMLTIVVGMNGWGLVSRCHFDRDPGKQQSLVSTLLLLAVTFSGLLAVLIVPAGRLLESATKFPASWLWALVLISLLSVIQTTYLGLVQARKEPGRYVWLQFVSITLNLGLSLFFVVSLAMDWRGRMMATLVTGVIVALISVDGLGRRLGLLRFTLRWDSARALASFGLPLIPHFIGGWVMTMVARLYLNNLATVADNGLYAVGFNLASPVAMCVGAAQQAYWPALFQTLSREEFERVRLARILLLAAAALPLAAVAYSWSVSWFLPLLVGPRFRDARPYILWLACAFALQGVYFIFGSFVVYSKRTSLMSWRADFLGGITVLVACPLFIHLMGPVGAALATALGYAVSTIGCITASRAAYPMPWREAAYSLVSAVRWQRYVDQRGCDDSVKEHHPED